MTVIVTPETPISGTLAFIDSVDGTLILAGGNFNHAVFDGGDDASSNDGSVDTVIFQEQTTTTAINQFINFETIKIVGGEVTWNGPITVDTASLDNGFFIMNAGHFIAPSSFDLTGNFNIESDSVFDASAGGANITGTVTNAGTINMAGSTVGDELKITGDYLGNGTLLVDSRWDDPDIQQTDHMIITGAADGMTTVAVPGGIIGDVTLGDAPKNGQWLTPVVSVEGTDLNQSHTFTGTAETTNAGQAQLVQRDDPNGGSNYYWVLAAQNPGTDPIPPGPDPVPIYTPGTPGYVQMSRIDREMGLEQLGKLHERRGDFRQVPRDQSANPIWGRLNITDQQEQGDKRFGYDTQTSFLQFGADLRARSDEAGNRLHQGVMVTYSRGDHDFYDKYRAENGVVSDRKHVGTGTTDMYSLGAYSTWYSANGTYLDLVGNLSGIHNTYDSASGSASQNGYGLGVSVAVGHPWQLGRSAWQIEPQAQLSYQYVHLNDFDDDVRTIDDQSGGTLRGRLGARLAYNNDNGEQRTHTFYVTANVLHDFTGNKSEARIGRDELRETYQRTWGELGVGAQFPLGKSAYLYGDVRYARAFSGGTDVYQGDDTARESTSGRVGVRFIW
ncbi:MAG: autotransporter outer membrane beta-barrel domain-containing protein [Castellaniella sp.]|uniref:autotransporter family protein n=1 Tax=Castellaniella sp. TaxID=1955812 RepID=UPI003A846A54